MAPIRAIEYPSHVFAPRLTRNGRILPIVSAMLVAALAACSDDPVRTTIPPPATSAYDIDLVVSFQRTQDVAARNSNDIYAAGNMLLHYDGARWRPLEFPETYSIDNIWVTANGEIYAQNWDDFFRYRGGRWSVVYTPGRLSDAFVSYNGEIFGIGEDGALLWFDGIDWHGHATTHNYYSIDGVGPDAVYAGGAGGWLAHFDGAAWSEVLVDSTLNIERVWPDGSGSAFLRELGDSYVWDGSSLTTGPFGDCYLRDCAGDGRGDVYAATDCDDIYQVRRKSRGWAPVVTRAAPIRGVHPCEDESIVVHDENGIAIMRGGTVEEILVDDSTHGNGITDLWGTPELGVFTTGMRVLRYHDGTVTDLHKESITRQTADAIHGSSLRDIYTVGDGMILHYDGDSWAYESGAFGHSVSDVWTDGKRSFAVGGGGLIVERDSGTWKSVGPETQGWLHVVTGWPGGALAAGDFGKMLLRDDSGWHVLPPQVSWDFFDAWADGPNNIYLCGNEEELVLHFDGRNWSTIATPLVNHDFEYIYSIAVTPPGTIFLATRRNGVHYYDGATWAKIPPASGSPSRLLAFSVREIYQGSNDGLLKYTRRGW